MHEAAGQHADRQDDEEGALRRAQERELQAAQDVAREDPPFSAQHADQEKVEREDADEYEPEEEVHVELGEEEDPENLQALVDPEPFVVGIKTRHGRENNVNNDENGYGDDQFLVHGRVPVYLFVGAGRQQAP